MNGQFGGRFEGIEKERKKFIFTISGHILVATGVVVSVVGVCPFASAIHSGGCCGCQYVGIKGLVVAMLLL